MMHVQGKSDLPIVPVKSPNKAAQAAAEAMEGRGGAKGNAIQGGARRTQSRESVSPALDRIREAAKRDKSFPMFGWAFAAAAASKVFLAMHRIAGDDMARHVDIFRQFPHGGDFVGLLVDLDMRQRRRRAGGESAEHLSGLGVVEAIETALERLAVERDNARFGTQAGRVIAKGSFNLRRAQSLQNVPDGRVGGRSLPSDFEAFVQHWPMRLDEGADTPIRVAPLTIARMENSRTCGKR